MSVTNVTLLMGFGFHINYRHAKFTDTDNPDDDLILVYQNTTPGNNLLPTRVITRSGQFTSFQSYLGIHCSWCSNIIRPRGETMYHRTSKETQCVEIRCEECHLIINRAFEYFTDKHPLLGELSADDYLLNTAREAEIKTQCRVLKKHLAYRCWLIQFIVPRDLYRQMIALYIGVACKENRIVWEDLAN